MKLPWRRDIPPDLYVEDRPKKSRETLTQTAEKIIQRRMKKDPDGYGLTAAERIKGIHHEAPKNVKDFLRELKEYKEIMDEAGLNQGGNKPLIQQILEVLPSLPKLMEQARQMQGQMQVQAMPQPYQQIEQPPHPRLQPKPEARPKPKQAPLPALVDVISLTPQEAVQLLQSEPGWLEILKARKPDEIVRMLEPFTSDAEHGQHVQTLIDYLQSEKGRTWLEQVIELVKNA